tara:strand:+ start:54 stop:440 length:387 start_codon:yes stop_codon:yes gene_type:complete
MSDDLKYCQGTKCHLYKTQDRIKGTKPNKTYQTRRRSRFYYGMGNFCSLNCQNDWFIKYGNLAIDHFGRTTEPKHLTQDNAWFKDYDYDWRSESNQHSNWRFVNSLTKEVRPITEEQYNDNDYTLNTV